MLSQIEIEQARLLKERIRKKMERIELERARESARLWQMRSDILVRWVQELTRAAPDSQERAEHALRLLYLLSLVPGYLSMALVQLVPCLEGSNLARELFLARIDKNLLEQLHREAIEPVTRSELERLLLLRHGEASDFAEPISLFEDSD